MTQNRTTNELYIPDTSMIRKAYSFVRPFLYEHVANLPFHGPDHTLNPIQGVIAETCKVMTYEGLSAEEREDGALTALFHDVGAAYRLAKNEPIGAAIASELLTAWGHPQSRVARINKAIVQTDPMCKPEGHFNYCVRDGDMANTGRPDGVEKTTLLMHEVYQNNPEHTGPILVLEQADFYEGSAKFIEGLPFLTSSGRALFPLQKENISSLRVLAQELKNTMPYMDGSIFRKENYQCISQL